MALSRVGKCFKDRALCARYWQTLTLVKEGNIEIKNLEDIARLAWEYPVFGRILRKNMLFAFRKKKQRFENFRIHSPSYNSLYSEADACCRYLESGEEFAYRSIKIPKRVQIPSLTRALLSDASELYQSFHLKIKRQLY